MKRLISAIALSAMMVNTAVFAQDSFFSTVIKVNVNEGSVIIGEEAFEYSCAPYVSENGTTMIQPEVFSYATDADIEVFEDGVYVTYEDTEMIYTQGSDKAVINGQIISMPESVVKTEEGTVMVPLRFFAESLGGDVVYNAETMEIDIKLSGEFDEGVDFHLLLKYSNMENIGNSKEKWRFKKPDNFELEDGFGNSCYLFYINDASVDLMVLKNNEKVTLEQLYIFAQQNYGMGVMFEKTKGTRSGLPYICTKFRNTGYIEENHIFVTDEFIYILSVNRPFEKFAAEKIDIDIENLLDSFEADYNGENGENTVDLAFESKKEFEPKEEYTDGNLSWNIKLSDGWIVDEYYGFDNYVSVYKDIESDNTIDIADILGFSNNSNYYNYGYDDEEKADISIATYSIEEEQASWISKRIKEKSGMYKPQYMNVSEIRDIKIGENNAKTITLTASMDDKMETYEYFYLDNDGYRYEIIFSYSENIHNVNQIVSEAHDIINSFTPGNINVEEIGKLLEADGRLVTDDITKEFENDDFTVTIPVLWSAAGDSYLRISNSEYAWYDEGIYININKESLSYYEDDMTCKELTTEQKLYRDLAENLNYDSDIELVSMPEKIEILGKPAWKTMIFDNVTNMMGEIIYVDMQDKTMISISIGYNDWYSSEYVEKMTGSIISSIKVK